MGYFIKDLDKLELSENRSNELDVFDGDSFIGKIHSSQLLPSAKNRRNNFELRIRKSDTIKIKDLSIYKSFDISTMKDSLISFQFIIPAFQRGYRWETEQVKELLEDIYVNYKKYYYSKLPEDFKLYCLQPLVLKKTGKYLNEFKVIDGQQRLTTITLLLEALNNQVPEENVFNAFIPISYEAREESEKFLYNIGEFCKNAIESVKENGGALISLEKKIEKTINCFEHEQLPEDLNSRYMLNTYLYAYWYFWEIIMGINEYKSYFDFAEKEWNTDEQWEPKRFTLIVKMLLETTYLIWYTIDNDDEEEHKVFEHFNSGRISLTGSELVKGIFMNPDNYLDSYDSNDNSNNKDFSLYEQLGTRQTLLGGQWDDMEKTLHNDEFWSFIPHQEDKEGEIEKSTHIDSIFNMYVYFNISQGKSLFNIDDSLFSFRKINEMITTRQAVRKGEKKFKGMWEIWLEIKNVYTTFYEWFIGDNYLNNVNSLYHRISLYKRIIYNTDLKYEQRYQEELKHMRLLYDILTTCNRKDREKLLNNEIAKTLLKTAEPGSNELKKFITTRIYGENANDVKVILLAFNLSTLEGAKAYGGRFPFVIFDKQKWHREHIFAKNTALSGEDNDEKKLYDALVSENEMNSYDKYLKLTNRSDKKLYEQTIEDINSIIDNQISGSDKDSLNTRLLKENGDILENILRDDHMGNMALLTETHNISISNDSYKDKSREISKWFKKGDFIPICTMNVFSDFYSNYESYSFHWLYAKRLSYLIQMINSVNEYLFDNEAVSIEDSINE